MSGFPGWVRSYWLWSRQGPGWWKMKVCSKYFSCLSLATVLLGFASVMHSSFACFFKCTFIILNKCSCHWNSRQNCITNVTLFSAAIWFIIGFPFQICCFLFGAFIVGKPAHEERKKQENGKQTRVMSIKFFWGNAGLPSSSIQTCCRISKVKIASRALKRRGNKD